eukprot:TRINITY_DN2698_c0_g2_i1.p1 TRINITY_DN2698_c0_g2~~TRINITY_DN2698_c0_g2_i1.p1  ORF type:complete len:579 (+),score=127.37 TRINITY_DN2698_c0_g2_i1:122-1858(+)
MKTDKNNMEENYIQMFTDLLDIPIPDESTNLLHRFDELVRALQPSERAIRHRLSIFKFIKNIVNETINSKCFLYGSVKLRTFLPDGDIDVGCDCSDCNCSPLELLIKLEKEFIRCMNSYNYSYPTIFIQEVELVRADVPVLKLIVNDYQVDITINQFQGLFTITFLEEMDRLIGKNHLFKKSTILIKGWCMYQSKILGGNNGLLSTYCLQGILTYIFVFSENIHPIETPFQALYLFLHVLKNFPWKTHALTVLGSVENNEMLRITTVEHKTIPKVFENFCEKSAVVRRTLYNGLRMLCFKYSYRPRKEALNKNHTFFLKSFNVLDPINLSNNIGRSVSESNFHRIQSVAGVALNLLNNIYNMNQNNNVHYFSSIELLDLFFYNVWSYVDISVLMPGRWYYDLEGSDIEDQLYESNTKPLVLFKDSYSSTSDDDLQEEEDLTGSIFVEKTKTIAEIMRSYQKESVEIENDNIQTMSLFDYDRFEEYTDISSIKYSKDDYLLCDLTETLNIIRQLVSIRKVLPNVNKRNKSERNNRSNNGKQRANSFNSKRRNSSLYKKSKYGNNIKILKEFRNGKRTFK